MAIDNPGERLTANSPEFAIVAGSIDEHLHEAPAARRIEVLVRQLVHARGARRSQAKAFGAGLKPVRKAPGTGRNGAAVSAQTRQRHTSVIQSTPAMEKAISIRLDEEAQEALRALTGSGRSQSDAVREAIVELARRGRRGVLVAEAERLSVDRGDRAEKARVARLMESLRAAR